MHATCPIYLHLTEIHLIVSELKQGQTDTTLPRWVNWCILYKQLKKKEEEEVQEKYKHPSYIQTFKSLIILSETEILHKINELCSLLTIEADN
jgi:hypothetical protein